MGPNLVWWNGQEGYFPMHARKPISDGGKQFKVHPANRVILYHLISITKIWSNFQQPKNDQYCDKNCEEIKGSLNDWIFKDVQKNLRKSKFHIILLYYIKISLYSLHTVTILLTIDKRNKILITDQRREEKTQIHEKY